MTATYTQTVAERLAVGDRFIRLDDREDSELDDTWSWELLVHDRTERGDYSSIVEVDGTTWTERFDPDEPVWLVTYTRPDPHT